MKLGQVVFTGDTKTGKKFLIRYPTKHDVKAMWQYINALSNENTFIRFQGERISFEDEENYVRSMLPRIESDIALQLLVFVDEQLVGTSNLDMYDRTDRHIGELGISISKDFRGEGIGTVLMKHTIKEGAEHLLGLEMITLSVFVNNQAAINMYKKFDFIEYGLLPRGVKLSDSYVDRVLMYKKLL